MPRLIVAIDGPAGSGKSTVARMLAERLGCVFLPSGTFYRALGLRALEEATPLEDEGALAALADRIRVDLRCEGGETHTIVDGRDRTEALKAPRVSDAASRLAVFPEVRRRVVRMQRDAAAQQSVVAEGRDMASVVFPEAQCKVYLDATVEERARRRALELRGRGETVDEAELAEEIAVRDRRDSSRDAAPLQQVPGATRVDTTGLSIQEVVERLVETIDSSRP